MEEGGKKLTPRQILAIPILAAEPSVEQGAEKAGVKLSPLPVHLVTSKTLNIPALRT